MNRRRRAFFIAEAVLGILVIVILATALAVLASQHSRVCNRLAASRAALREAETALAQMQMGRAPAASASISPIDFDSEVGHMVWVQVSTEHDGARARLIGLVPRSSLPAEGGR
jgi:type II secretory pathway pseudopilin PulG